MQKPSEKPQRRLCVPPALDHEVQNLSFIVDCAPQIHPLAADPADHLVQVPARRGRWPAALQSPCNERSKLDRPAPDRLVADLNPTLREQLLDVPKTDAEPEEQPQGVADHVSRKSVAFERDRLHET